jgi:23S rRNA (adenine2030-N6)-methyltransferase
MLSYRHAFHAGNHADILKHETLVLILEQLRQKDKPFTIIDTHAGAGRYSFDDPFSLKTGESRAGIKRLLTFAAESGTDSSRVPVELKTYLAITASYANRNTYPGSPEIERCLMRHGDTCILCELHPAEAACLKRNMKLPLLYRTTTENSSGGNSGQVHIHYRDGYEALEALTPPATARGIVLTDPSYEDSSDYEKAAEVFARVHRKWSNGILVLWYPLLNYRSAEIASLKRTILTAAGQGKKQPPVLNFELLVHTKESHQETTLRGSIGSAIPRLYGSGMIVVNPPWKLTEKIGNVLPFLADTLSGTGSYTITDYPAAGTPHLPE